MDSKTVVTKETKRRIRVDYEGKLSFKERMLKKLKTSNTWIKIVVNIFRFVLMLGVSYVILFPFISRIAGSFMTLEDYSSPLVALIPNTPTLQIYKSVFLENHYTDAFINTLLLSLLCAILQTFVACLVGYGLSKFKFKGNKAVMIAVVVTMIVPHIALSGAMNKQFTNFDFFHVISWNYAGPLEMIFGEPISLQESFWPLVILSVTGLAFKNGLYIYLMRQFFKGVPDELEESAYVDGANTLRTFFQIIIPLSIPMMITIFLFSFSWQWTDTFYTRLCFSDATLPEDRTWLMCDIVKYTPESLSKLYDSKGVGPSSGDTRWTEYTSVINNTAGIMAIAPLIIIYLFCQRYLVQGIERSGLVG